MNLKNDTNKLSFVKDAKIIYQNAKKLLGDIQYKNLEFKYRNDLEHYYIDVQGFCIYLENYVDIFNNFPYSSSIAVINFKVDKYINSIHLRLFTYYNEKYSTEIANESIKLLLFQRYVNNHPDQYEFFPESRIDPEKGNLIAQYLMKDMKTAIDIFYK